MQAFPEDGAPYGIRTRVLALRGPRPRPLDEGSNVDREAVTGWTTGLQTFVDVCSLLVYQACERRNAAFWKLFA